MTSNIIRCFRFIILCVVRLEEGGVLTDCSIKTMEPDETLDFNFCSTNVVNKIIMKVIVPLLPAAFAHLLNF